MKKSTSSKKKIAFMQSGGKQFKVEVGGSIFVDLCKQAKGSEIIFNQVCLIKDGEQHHIGAPYLEGGRIVGEVMGNVKGEKKVVFKKKRRKGYKVKRNHRQHYTKVNIKEIVIA